MVLTEHHDWPKAAAAERASGRGRCPGASASDGPEEPREERWGQVSRRKSKTAKKFAVKREEKADFAAILRLPRDESLKGFADNLEVLAKARP